MKCKDCGTIITWDNSYGKINYLVCEKCWNKMVSNTNLITAYTNLMKKDIDNTQSLCYNKEKERKG